MGRSFKQPLVDQRLFLGLVVVLGAQVLFWFTVGVIWFGVGSTTEDHFAIIFFGIALSVPAVIGAFVIGLGPGVVIWVGMMHACKLASLTERQSAILSAPVVAMVVSVICLIGMVHAVSQNPAINPDLMLSAIIFSGPAMIAAAIYAHLAWPRVANYKETGS